MVFIYALKLTGNKYYIGKTEDPQFRLETHFSQKRGSAWTKKYSPIQIHEIIPDQSDYDEQRVTQEYMNKYGIDNVRGGPWCNVNLTNEVKEMIQKILNSSSDKCYKCGEQGHFAKFCPTKTASASSKTASASSKTASASSKTTFVSSKTTFVSSKKTKNCQRCGRYGHNESQCYAKTYYNGGLIELESDEDEYDEEDEEDSEEEEDSDDEEEEDIWYCQYCNRGFDSNRGCVFHENVHCGKRKLNKKFNSARYLVDELYLSDDSD